MKEYTIVYRDGDIYKIIDRIFSKDSAYEVLAMVIKAGYEDSRIEEKGEFNHAKLVFYKNYN